MAQPPPYTPTTDFSDEELNNVAGRGAVRTAALDTELAAIETTLDATLDNLELVQRDDGEIRDRTVKLHTLAEETVALFAAGHGTIKGAWLTGTAYALRDVVSQSGNSYICAIAHTAGTFATDLAAGRWVPLAFAGSTSAGVISFTPTGTIAASNVQAAIAELTADLESAEATIASAAAINIGATAGRYINVTGTTSISSLGTAAVGIWKILRFSNAAGLTLAYNATSLITDTGANIQTTPYNRYLAQSLGGGNWRISELQGGAFLAAGASAVPRTVQAKLRDVVSVWDYMTAGQRADAAAGTAAVDQLSAFQAALASGAPVVRVEGRGPFRLSAGITIPENVELVGDAMFAGNPPTGTVLQFDNSVATCVTLQGSTGKLTNGIRRLVIKRATGAPPAGSIGVRINLTYNSLLEDVFAYNHATGFRWDDVGPDGIGCRAHRIFTGAISDAHLVFNRWPECVITDGRFGMNDGGDLGATAFVRVTGAPDGLGGAPGPNTLLFRNCIFIESGTGVSYFWQYQNMTMAIGDAVVYKVTDCHVENLRAGGAIFQSDAASLYMGRWSLVGNVFNCPAVTAFAINAATRIYQFKAVNNDWFATAVTLNNDIRESKFANNFFNPTVSITGTNASDTLSLHGNHYNGGLALAGTWSRLDVVGGVINGALTDTATNSYITELIDAINWTPVLQIGGLTTGIVYSVQAGQIQRIGKTIIAKFQIHLSSKGALTGTLAIAGLPWTSANVATEMGSGGVVNYCENMAGLTMPLHLHVGQNSASIYLYYQGAAASQTLDHTHLTNTSRICGQVIYRKA